MRAHAAAMVAAGLLLGACFRIAATYSVFNQTWDEPAHIASGLEWLQRGRYEFEPLHPPAARVAAALGPFLDGARLTPDDPNPWTQTARILGTGAAYFRMLALARVANLAFFLAAGVALFSFVLRALGPWPATVAILLFSTVPPFLGHAGLATTDVALAAGVIVSLTALILWLDHPSRLRGVLLGAAIGGTVLTKFSALLLLPLIFAVTIASCRLSGKFESPTRKAGVALHRLLRPVWLTALVVLWAGYRFSVGPIVPARGPQHCETSTPCMADSLPPAVAALATAPVYPAPEFVRGLVAYAREGRTRQLAFDARLRAADRRTVTRGRVLRAQRSVGIPGPAKAQVAPDVGSIRSFRVIASTDTTKADVFKTVNARLAYVGANILLYVDTLTAVNGFASGDLSGIGNLFDQTLYPIDLNAFGQPSDIDQNGHLVMLMTPVVNALTPSADCKDVGYIAGFFTGYDLASTSTDSNRGEVFYTIAPDPAGVSSCAHTVADIEFSVPATFLHEVQHLINFSQHVILHNGTEPEEGWLDEGLSRVAEELGSRYYEQKFPPPTGRTNTLQLFPDSSQGFIGGVLTDSYTYLLKPDTATVTLHSDADDGLAWRGSVWLLVRWLGDLKGEDIYKRLEATTLIGTANIEAAAGESFQGLFSDFGIAMYTDSIPGLDRSSIPQRDRFVTRNLRQMYAALFRAAGPSADVPIGFPIVPRSILANQAISASMLPGTVAYYRIDTSAGSGPVQVRFATPAGGALQASLHPQVAIFRLPPGAG